MKINIGSAELEFKKAPKNAGSSWAVERLDPETGKVVSSTRVTGWRASVVIVGIGVLAGAIILAAIILPVIW